MPVPESGRRRLRAYVALVLAGVAIRLAFLLLAGELKPFADEANYIYYAMCLDRLGLYLGGAVFVWPPGYPFFLSLFLGLFQADGVFAAKLFQVLLSGVVGWFTMLFAERLFGARAALIAGGLWAVHLHFIGFTHTLWPETLFLALLLPSLYLVHARLVSSEGPKQAWDVALAGCLLGLCVLLKEAASYLGLLLAGLIVWQRRGRSWGTALSEGSAFLLAMLISLLPWMLRNNEVYGRLTVAATLGENCYESIMRPYRALDYVMFDVRQLYGEDHWQTRAFMDQPEDMRKHRKWIWNLVDRSKGHVEEARVIAMQHPAWFLRSRVKRLANWFAPTSFFIRHHSMGLYEGVLGSTPVKHLLILLGLLQEVAVLGLAVPGFFLALGNKPSRRLVALLLLYFVATGLLVGMTRHRMAVEPLLLVLTAGFLSGARSPWLPGRWPRAGVLACWACLGLLWLLDLRELLAQLVVAWVGPS